MQVTVFDYSGRFAHFLRAEATANALTYPVPPRTVLLGLTGALLGLSKDTVQEVLAKAHFAVGGAVPKKHWHKANMRKSLPAPLRFQVKKSEKGSSKEEKNTRIPQEMLWKPAFKIFAALPESHHDEFAARLVERRWHFTPCLGLSELLADLNWLATEQATQLSESVHEINSAVRLEHAELDASTAYSKNLAIQKLRMPRDVTSDRVFSHANYLLERDGKPIPVKTHRAWQVGNEKVMFL
jgi:CRISPR-associated protein Cas5h